MRSSDLLSPGTTTELESTPMSSLASDSIVFVCLCECMLFG